eukprot:7406665-Ditylum_brightwellii.AAC.1
MDTFLWLGLLAHPSKIKWAAQCQHFCSFVYGTTGIPHIEVPIDKQDDATALLTYLESLPQRLSHLALLEVVGRLQSMVPAMPGNVAQSGEEWWMGVWANYGIATSSNWKELQMLVETLEWEWKFDGGSSSSATLHTLVKHVKFLAAQLETMLEVEPLCLLLHHDSVWKILLIGPQISFSIKCPYGHPPLGWHGKPLAISHPSG